MLQLLYSLLVYLIVILSVQSSWAVSSKTSAFSLGLSGGALITSDVPGWGGVATGYNVHFGFPAWETPMELTLSAGGSGEDRFYALRVVYLGEHIIDPELSMLYWIGPSYLSFDPVEIDKPRASLGGTVGGGLKVRVTGGLYLRLDMAVFSSPGSSAYSGFGLIFDI